MNGKSTTVGLSLFLVAFYIVIILYVMFEIIGINTLENFGTALSFEITGFILLIYFVMANIWGKKFKTGFYVPLVVATILYTILLDALNMALVSVISHSIFTLLNMVLLFIYGLISVPMYIMGKR